MAGDPRDYLTGDEKEAPGDPAPARPADREPPRRHPGLLTGPSQERMTVNALLDSLVADYRTRGIKSLQQHQPHETRQSFFGERRVGNCHAGPRTESNTLRPGKSDGRSNAKVNREVELLNAAFCLAVREGCSSTASRTSETSGTKRSHGFLREGRVQEDPLPCLPPPIDDMARFAYSSGWRYEEIRTLLGERVDRCSRSLSSTRRTARGESFRLRTRVGVSSRALDAAAIPAAQG